MKRPARRTVQQRFFVALGHAIRLAWPVLSIILAIQVALGLLTGFVESWSVGDAIYFTFVTGLTIGYGDIVPRQAAWACTCGWDWYLWARAHGPHNGDCGLCHAHSACRARKQLTPITIVVARIAGPNLPAIVKANRQLKGPNRIERVPVLELDW